MNFDFENAGHEAQHIARFMDMAQDCLEHMQPLPDEKGKHLESLYSLILMSERIAQGLMEMLEAAEREAMQARRVQPEE